MFLNTACITRVDDQHSPPDRAIVPPLLALMSNLKKTPAPYGSH